MVIMNSRRIPALAVAALSASLALAGLGALAPGAPALGAPSGDAGTPSGAAVGAVTAPVDAPANPGAPRPYFPADVTRIPATDSLPDLFAFFGRGADPNHDGRVDTAAEWPARASELSDLMQYYLYGYKHPTPESGSVFGQETVPAVTTINFSAVFDSKTFTIALPQGSYTLDFSTFTLYPVLDFVAQAAYTAPAGFDGWAAGDSWSTPSHQRLLTTTPAHQRTVVTVTDPGAPGKTTATIRLDGFEVPQQGVDTDLPGPYPAVLVVGGLSTEQVTTLKRNGYAYISMNTGSVYSDGANNPHTGAYNELYPYRAGSYEYDSGTLMGWAWGISRIVDAMRNDATGADRYHLAWNRTAVTGVSRNGKAAALAAAFDPRIAIAAPSDPGGGGLTGFRDLTEAQLFTYNTPAGQDQIYSRNETVQRAIGNGSESAWFSSKAQDFLPDKADHAPFDLHAVAALVAPRPFILWTGEAQQAWLGSPSSVLSMQAASQAYELLGAGGNIAWVVRDAQHANQDRDLPDLIGIMDRTFGRSPTLTRRHLDTLATADGSAIDGSGVIYPEATFRSIADMTRNPYDLENSLVRWSRPGKDTLWSEDTYLTAGMPRLLTFHTDAREVALALPGGRRLTAPARHGVATFLLPAEAVRAGRYVAETRGGTKAHRSIELAGLSLRDALRHGLNLSSGSPDGAAVGFTSPVANYGTPTDPVLMTVDGNPITTSVYDDGAHQGYLERYGASLKLSGAPDGPWDGSTSLTFGVRNLRLAALPGFTFGVDVGLTKAQVPNFMGQPTNGFTSAFGERPSWSSDDLQNTPISGNFHGRWPLYPNAAGDTGQRPTSIPSRTAFATTITAADAGPDGVTLRFGTPLNRREFGLGLNLPAGWTIAWSTDATSVRITYGRTLPRHWAVQVIVFRAVDAAGNMIGGPQLLTARG
jgi:hypothetical protein